jgi:hypothetical protein
MNVFMALNRDDGTVWAVSLLGESFDQEAVFADAFLRCADYRFVSHGDGLIVIRALEGTAVYGEVGRAEDHHGAAVRARLLQVTPRVIDHALEGAA